MKALNYLLIAGLGCTLALASTVTLAQGHQRLRPEVRRALPAGQPVEDPDLTFTVQCDNPASRTIAEVLERAKNRDLSVLVNIRGFCDEAVRIEDMRDVTLSGRSPDLDGIAGPTGDPDAVALVHVHDSERILIDGLAVQGGEGIGIGAWYSGVDISNSLLADNAGSGLHYSASSHGLISDTIISGNGGYGLRGQRNALVTCSRCSFENNADGGVAGLLLGQVQVVDSDISEDLAVLGYASGEAWILDSTVSGNLIGRFKGYVELWGVTQTNPDAVNEFWMESTLAVFSFSETPTTLTGTTDLSALSHGVIYDATVSDISCEEGSDAICNGAIITSSSCGLCPAE